MGRTIRTCSLALVALLPSIVFAKANDVSALAAYARGRAADGAGDTLGAVASYSAAMTLSQDASLVALRAYRAGIEGGDYALALRGARALDAIGVLPGDARVFLYIAAVRERDWRAARKRLDDLARESGYEFLEPLFGAWLAFETGETLPDRPGRSTAYAAENAALLAIARSAHAEGAVQLRALWPSDPWRARTARMAGAATLAGRKDWTTAASLLPEGSPARSLLDKRQRISNPVNTAARGAAFVLQRTGWDLAVERSQRASVTLARLATFADPQGPLARTVLTAALVIAKRPAEALAEAGSLARDPVYRPLAEPFVIDALEALGRSDEALVRAQALSDNSVEGLARIGDIQVRRGEFAQGVATYRRVLAANPDAEVAPRLWYALGNALERVDDWPAARDALERALERSPNDPNFLNQLGYGLANRGLDLDRALSLLRRAEAAAPDNAAIVDSVGWAMFKSGRFDDAIITLERARSLDNDEPEILEHLGDAYWKAGRRIDARHAWAAARVSAEESSFGRIDGKIARGLD